MNIIRNAVIKALEQNHVNDEIEVEFNDRNLKILVPKNASQELKYCNRTWINEQAVSK